MDQTFLRYLHQPCHIAPLLFLTADKSLNIRNQALALLGKLADKNPALILPPLRQVLKKVICDLRSGATYRIREGTLECCAQEASLALFSFSQPSSCSHSLLTVMPCSAHPGAALTMSVLLRALPLRATFLPLLGTIIQALPIDPFLLPACEDQPELSGALVEGGVTVTTLRVHAETQDSLLDNAVVTAGMRALGELSAGWPCCASFVY